MTSILKSFTGALSWQLFADTARAILGRIQWAVVLERLLTRLVVSGLRWLQRLSTNDLVDETVDLIVAMLEEKRLVKAREYQRSIDKKPSSSAESNKDI